MSPTPVDREETLNLLSKLVSIPTVNNPREGRKVTEDQARQVLEALKSRGLAEARLLNPRGSPIIVWSRGSGRPIGLYLAHIDVVPPGGGWLDDPFKLRLVDDKGVARGAADDKGNVTAMALGLGGTEPGKGTIILAFTSDEETGGFNGALALLEHLRNQDQLPDYVVNGDGAFSRVIIRRRNVFLTSLTIPYAQHRAHGCLVERTFEARLSKPTQHAAYFTPGVDAHPLIQASDWVRNNNLLVASMWVDNVKNNVIPQKARVTAIAPCGSPECGKSPCIEHEYDPNLTSLLNALLPLSRTPLDVEGYSDYGITVTPNTYYTTGKGYELEVDIRAMVTEENHVRHRLTQALEENKVPNYQLEVTSGGGFLNTPRDHWLVKLATQTNYELGLDPTPMEAAGASDSRHFSSRAIPSIDYGPLGWNIHGPEEAVSIPHLLKAVQFYRVLASKIHGD